LDRTRYLSTVDLATSIPSLRSSPTIRGELQPTLAADTLRINALISFGYRWSTWPALFAQSSPMITKALTLPGNHGPCLDKDNPPTGPAAREPRPDNAISRFNPGTLNCSPIDSKLMSQRNDLKLYRQPRAKLARYKCKQRTNDSFQGSKVASAVTINKDFGLTPPLKQFKNIRQYGFSGMTTLQRDQEPTASTPAETNDRRFPEVNRDGNSRGHPREAPAPASAHSVTTYTPLPPARRAAHAAKRSGSHDRTSDASAGERPRGTLRAGAGSEGSRSPTATPGRFYVCLLGSCHTGRTERADSPSG
jgi:hypothetical protein